MLGPARRGSRGGGLPAAAHTQRFSGLAKALVTFLSLRSPGHEQMPDVKVVQMTLDGTSVVARTGQGTRVTVGIIPEEVG